MNFFTKLTILCGEKNLTPSRVANDIGMSRAAATSWKKGTDPSPGTIQKIADYFGVDVKVFYEDDDDKPEIITSQALGAMIMMPVIGSVKAGYGMPAVEEYTGEYAMIGVDTVKNNPQDHRVLKVTGDSMYPFFLDGDYVVVRIQPQAESGDIVVAILNGEGTIKKLHHREDGRAELVPYNPMYAPVIMGAEDRIYGKVVELKRSL